MRWAEFSIVLAASVLTGGAAAAQEPAGDAANIVVFHRDGRVIEGVLDPQSDSETLWLRRDTESATLRSGFSWKELDRIGSGQAVLTAEQFRQQAQGMTKRPSPASQENRLEPLSKPTSFDPRAFLSRSEMATLQNPRIRSLEVFAYPANWDSDAETDGLRVHVMPLDAQGRIVPIDGQLDCVLVGKDVRRSYVLDVQPPAFRELGRWSERIRTVDFGDAGAIVELPFSSQHPEFDRHLIPEGLLTARLGVSSQGVFDASDAWVLLRPWSTIRDELQLFTGRRTHPAENILQKSTLYPTRTPNRRADDRAR